MSLPFLHRHTSLTPSLRHLDSNFSYRSKGPSMSCARQRQKSVSTQHFSCDRQRRKSVSTTFFKTHSQLFLYFRHSPNLDPKYLFQKKSSSAQLMLYVPSIPSPPHVIDTSTPPSGLTLFLPRQGSINVM